MKKYILVLIAFLFSFCMAQQMPTIKENELIQTKIVPYKNKKLPKIKKPDRKIQVERPKLKENPNKINKS